MVWLLAAVGAVVMTLARIVHDVWAQYRTGQRSVATALAITCIVAGLPVVYAAEQAKAAGMRTALQAVSIGLGIGGGVFGAVGLVLDRRLGKARDAHQGDTDSLPMKTTFEAGVTLGRAQWITSIEADEAMKRLWIGLTHHPESHATERRIEFHGVTKVVSEWSERDDGCMESILGANEDHDGQQLRYMLVTEQRALTIWASEPATIS